MNPTAVIEEVSSSSQLKQFIKIPFQIYRDDPLWVPPLISEEKKRFHTKKNPFFEHGEAQFFIARRNGTSVGRISAHIDRHHNVNHHEKTGFFGFLECVDDPSVSRGLLDAACTWLRTRGMEKIRGPFNFSINEEVGILIDGFDQLPFLMTSYNPPYYPGHLESFGFKKIKDLYSWRYDSRRPVPEPAMQVAEAIRAFPGLTIREVNPREMMKEVRIIVDVFNSAWSQNWGFVPMTDQEIKKGADDFKMILEPKLALIAEVEGKPAAIALALPNLNEAIRDLRGRLFPFGFFKLLYRLKTRKIRSARLIALGVKKEFRVGGLRGLSVLLYSEMHRRSNELGHWGGELSWTLDDNDKINTGIKLMGGEKYKTHRIYEKEL